MEAMATEPSVFIFCQECDRKFKSPVVYKIHMENSHPYIFVTSLALKNENSQNLLSQDMTNFAQDSTLVPIKDIQDELKAAQKYLNKLSTNFQRQKPLKNAKRFQCKICSRSLDRQKLLTTHMNRIHMEKLKCHLCEKSFGCQTNLKQHTDGVHAIEKKFECQECKKCFSLGVHLRTHIRFVHENVRAFKCSLCELSFHLRDGLTLHIKCVHEKPFKCEMCGGCWGVESSLKQHMINRHNPSNPKVCQTCRYTFSRKKTLNKHLKKMHNNEGEVQNTLIVKSGPVPTMKCEYCENMYTSSRGVHLHQAREHKDLWLARRNCKICYKSFNTAHYVAIHAKLVHEGTKPFECTFCQKKFKLKYTLKVHVNGVHKKMRRYGCCSCKDRFNSPMSRDKHIFICASNSNLEID